MKIPFSYVARNLWFRKLTTLLTASGMALVVFVFAAVLMLDAGLKSTLVSTGAPDNVVVIRQGSETEVQSGLLRDQASLVETAPEVARAPDGASSASKEVVVLNSLPKREDPTKRSNVVVRGLSPKGLALRPQVKIVEGRMFRSGSNEIVVGSSVARQFAGVEVGQQLSFAGRQWTVVGVSDAGKTAFDSEIWGDVDQLMQAFRRGAYSSMIARLNRPEDFDALRARLDEDPRLKVTVKRERQFYEDQSRALSNFITLLGMALSVIFSLGAMIGAAITMYAAVATRTAEIGTLRALGFRRASVLVAFLTESLLLAVVGGLAGLGAASFLTAITISTTNFQSFSELAFSFQLTPRIVVQSLAFALLMGLVGGFLPAIKASRMKIVDALRAD
ncbi:MAG TPA: ABC transporter permease [Burkholderiaceae bacterium]|jgi:ABC-type lipoprotein release transport system permease subunit|nr:ABC transporter permease [Burkholderiaceae bacterium]HPE01389.1 ABC transporter permease [Burkholderiaceae bacterium]